MPKGYFVKRFPIKTEVKLDKKDSFSLGNLAKSAGCFFYDVDIDKS